MSFVKHTLSDDEVILHEARLTMWYTGPFVGAGVLWTIIGLIAIFHGIGALLLLSGLILVACAYLNYCTTEFAVTNKRIVAQLGVVWRQTIELDVKSVESIQVSQSILGRLLNYGSLTFSGAGNPMAVISHVDNPLAFRKKCLEAMES